MHKITVDGKTMWESNEGERLKEPGEKPDTSGWRAIYVNGKRMWESPEGERVLEP